MIEATKLREYIWQDIRKEVSDSGIRFYIPFCFGTEDDMPLYLTWDRDGTLSDRGRTVSELKKRVGDISPYLDSIHRILARCADCRLVGGQIIVKDRFQTVISGQEQYPDYLGGMNQMLKAITLISVLDTISVSDDGEVSV